MTVNYLLFQEALVLAERDGVAGRDVTPFVLSRVAELTGGKSVDANLALIEERRLPGCQEIVSNGRVTFYCH